MENREEKKWKRYFILRLSVNCNCSGVRSQNTEFRMKEHSAVETFGLAEKPFMSVISKG